MPVDRRWLPKSSAGKDVTAGVAGAPLASGGPARPKGTSGGGNAGPTGGSGGARGPLTAEKKSSSASKASAQQSSGKERRRKRRVKKSAAGASEHNSEAGGSAGTSESATHAREAEEERRRREKEAAAQRAHEEALENRLKEGEEWYENFCKAYFTRKALREGNVTKVPLSESELQQLDSSLKKCTGFVRKLRAGVNEETKDVLLVEAESLNLSRYTSEMVSAITECKLRTSDVDVIVTVCSKLHQRFPDFSHDLAPTLAKLASGSTSSGSTRADAATRRGAIRLLAEVICVRISAEEQYILSAVRDLVKPLPDGERDIQLANLSVVASFARSYGREFLNSKLVNPYGDVMEEIINRAKERGQEIITVEELVSDEKSLIKEETKAALRPCLENYFKYVCRWLDVAHRAYKRAEAENISIRQVQGEVPENQIAAYEKDKRVFEKLYSGASSLADGLGMQIPDLQEDEKTTRIVNTENRGAAATAAAASVAAEKQEPIFEDESEENFYQQLPDLKNCVFHDDVVEDAQETGGEETKSDPKVSAEDSSAPASKTGVKKGRISASSGNQADALIATLHTCDSKEGADKFAAAFAPVATRAACRKLCRAMLATPPQKLNVLPYYARLAASLGQHFPDVTTSLVQMLEEEFKQLISRKDQDEKLLVVRVRNACFLGELTKFQLVPPSSVFELVNRCLIDFTHHNVDVVCSILETCGKFLYRTPETAFRTGNLLDKMWRLKSVRNLDARQNAMVETAYFATRPPERQQHQKVKKSKDPILEYARQRIIHAELTKSNFEWTLKQMRKLPWNEGLDDYVARKVLKTEKLRFSSLNLTAPLIASIAKFREGFGITVLDGLLESIRYGLEINDPRMNQRRIAEIKLLGELYNCHSIDAVLIFEVLYLLITLGHDSNSDVMAPDAEGDFFRARLVCVLLDTCGKYLDRGQARKRLNVFLTYFDNYLLLKCIHAGYGNHLPREVEFFVTETFESLRKGMKIPETLDEAQEEVAAIEQSPSFASLITLPRFDIVSKAAPLNSGSDTTSSKKKGGVRQANFEEEDEEDTAEKDDKDVFSEESSDEDVSDSSRDDDEEESEMDLEDDEEADDEESNSEDEDEDEDVMVTHVDRPRTHEEDDFDRELANVTAESLSIAKSSIKGTTLERMAVPMGIFGLGKSPGHTQSGADAPEVSSRKAPSSRDGTVSFRMLYRSRGRNQTKELAVPARSAFATAAKVNEDSERAQQQEMKRLVLGSNAVMSDDGMEHWNEGDLQGSRGGGRKGKKAAEEANILSSMFKASKPR